MMRSLSHALRFTALTLLLLAAPAAWGQTNDEVNAGIQLNFSTPGARSLALGGAFIGLADDATAAFTNPAGLTILSRPEISIEGRRWSYTHRYSDRGRFSGDLTNMGIDSEPGIVEGESSADVEGFSFSSFVYPRKRWAIAFYRHELANFEAGFRTEGIYLDGLDTGDPPQVDMFRLFPTASEMDLEIVNFGISFAVKLTERFSIGIGGSYYDFQLDSRTRRYSFSNPESEDQGGFFGLPDYRDANIFNFQTQQGDDNDQTFTLGFLWNMGEKVSLGGVYRKGPEFTFSVRNIAGPASSADEGAILIEHNNVAFNIPDVYGLGFVFHLTDALTLALDWNHVEYSTLTESTANVFGSSYEEATRRLEIDDADEFHLGLEYVFVNIRVPLAIRLGAWYDPDHRIAFQGEPGMTASERGIAALFREGDDEIHYSAGLGLVFGDHVQVDMAADFSDIVDTFSLSGVFRF